MDYIQHLRSMVGNEKVIMVVAGAFVFDIKNRVLMQKRSDTGQWGFPGGFMDLGESVQDTARREVYEETGLKLDVLELFGIYSGPQYDKTFSNGDQVSLVLISFICKQYSGELVESNEESIQNKFYSLKELPENIFTEHKMLIDDLLSKKQLPIIG
ncbi:8-oxo-dGTP pyrophosphatase MutT (NUDIX family) [Paenibacillus rhizosphaerae]|uniref:8-oxo-dGTP pyrophosphatase MutT (NUDIX family) n=1 Tax=Paenibacillus rhizosphaerae TaxID=297318 RepID=A0A839U0J6_9BACL|nr:NUDIX domain-containing protein [Paenibacillus rhizosphaerae]MBB3132263.1 8-oxo-dGTP pyrophosphatase MutT (NUDIX family) [Paenibacillus rhizosphaerae]